MGCHLTTLFGTNALPTVATIEVPAPPKKRGWLPLLTVLFLISYGLMTMLIVGGMGSIAGSIVGALTLTILPEMLRFLGQWYLVLYGLGVIVVIVLLPGGLASMTTAFPFRRAGAR